MRLVAAFPLLLALVACPARRPLPEVPVDLDVVELTIAEAQARMETGALSAEALTRAYLARIAAIDDAGPRLNAVIALNPGAVDDAVARDAERAAGHVRGPLHGVPVLIKDNIDVAGMVTSAGSLALAEHRPAADAELVGRLREAGAVILGKTNLSEWANFRSTRSVSGWSSLGGQTRNPYALDRNPCGSSAGTGAAIAASLAMVGVGTETDGSIACPCAVSGLVGLKPGVGRVSQRGIVPISASQDTAGPMARTVTDAALLYDALSGGAGEALRPALAGKRIGVLRQATGYHPDLDRVFEDSLRTMAGLGAVIVDPVEIPTWGQWDAPELEVLLYEFKDGLERYLAETQAQPRTLDALIAWNTAHAAEVMPWFGQEIFEMAAAKGPLTEPAYLEAREAARRLAGPEGLEVALSGVDLLVAPATAPAWTIDPISGDHFLGAGWGAAAVAGTPSLTLPMGAVHGLPVGMVWMGPAGSERTLLEAGLAFEQATRARRPPTLAETLD